jgi:hypothetical protein
VKSFLLVRCCCCHSNHDFDFMCTSCIICYHATQIVGIPHSPTVFDLSFSEFLDNLPLHFHISTFTFYCTEFFF